MSAVLAVNVLILAAGAGCDWLPGNKSQGNNQARGMGTMEQLLENYLSGQLSPSDFGLTYRIGDSFSGLTEFSVNGDGAYELRSTATRGRQERTYASTVSPDRVRQVAGDLRKARIWETRHVRSKPGEDDPLASVAVESGASKAGVELWVSEIKDVQPFQEAQQSLLGLIREISNGEVLETGR